MIGGSSLSELRVAAIFELVMGIEATWLALEHRPTKRQIQEIADAVLLPVTSPN
jgi:hypothetical protein